MRKIVYQICLIHIAATVTIFKAQISSSETVSIARRSITFNDIIPKTKIKFESGYVINDLSTQNRFECSIACLKKPECKSYTFCHTFCYLNSIGFPELQRIYLFHLYILSDENCDLFSMEKSFIPECEENGSTRSILNDSSPNYCEINKKRVDGLFREREYFNASINTTEEFKGFTTRKCLPETALNGGYCKHERKTQEVWVKWITSKVDHAQSLQGCVDLGGVLYPDLDGDREQIEFLKRNKQKSKMWLGLTKASSDWYLWKNLRGESMKPDRIRWSEFEHDSAEEFVRTVTQSSAVAMKPSSDKGKAACQMLI